MTTICRRMSKFPMYRIWHFMPRPQSITNEISLRRKILLFPLVKRFFFLFSYVVLYFDSLCTSLAKRTYFGPKMWPGGKKKEILSSVSTKLRVLDLKDASLSFFFVPTLLFYFSFRSTCACVFVCAT